MSSKGGKEAIRKAGFLLVHKGCCPKKIKVKEILGWRGDWLKVVSLDFATNKYPFAKYEEVGDWGSLEAGILLQGYWWVEHSFSQPCCVAKLLWNRCVTQDFI